MEIMVFPYKRHGWFTTRGEERSGASVGQAENLCLEAKQLLQRSAGLRQANLCCRKEP